MGYMRLGSVYAAQNDSAKARDAFEAGRAIIVRLVELSPQNAVSKKLPPHVQFNAHHNQPLRPPGFSTSPRANAERSSYQI